jgi:hypothetical protein
LTQSIADTAENLPGTYPTDPSLVLANIRGRPTRANCARHTRTHTVNSEILDTIDSHQTVTWFVPFAVLGAWMLLVVMTAAIV